MYGGLFHSFPTQLFIALPGYGALKVASATVRSWFKYNIPCSIEAMQANVGGVRCIWKGRWCMNTNTRRKIHAWCIIQNKRCICFSYVVHVLQSNCSQVRLTQYMKTFSDRMRIIHGEMGKARLPGWSSSSFPHKLKSLVIYHYIAIKVTAILLSSITETHRNSLCQDPL